VAAAFVRARAPGTKPASLGVAAGEREVVGAALLDRGGDQLGWNALRGQPHADQARGCAPPCKGTGLAARIQLVVDQTRGHDPVDDRRDRGHQLFRDRLPRFETALHLAQKDAAKVLGGRAEALQIMDCRALEICGIDSTLHPPPLLRAGAMRLSGQVCATA
jgi:hypothetical protein